MDGHGLLPLKFRNRVFIRPSEAAELLCVSVSRIYQLINDGILDVANERPYRVTVFSLQRYLHDLTLPLSAEEDLGE